MPKELTVNEFITYLSKYPGHLKVRMYRYPFQTAYRPLSPHDARVSPKNRWLYNTTSLYLPISPTKKATLPETYNTHLHIHRTKESMIAKAKKGAQRKANEQCDT